jgi:transcriptional regulator with XRE-family HTH domain
MSNIFLEKSNFFLHFFRKSSMEAKGWTIKELARELGIKENAVKQRVFKAKITPIIREAIYPPDTLERIREAPMGRPPKKPKP